MNPVRELKKIAADLERGMKKAFSIKDAIEARNLLKGLLSAQKTIENFISQNVDLFGEANESAIASKMQDEIGVGNKFMEARNLYVGLNRSLGGDWYDYLWNTGEVDKALETLEREIEF